MASDQTVHTVVLDTGAIIKNEPPVSTLLSRAETLVTVPAILAEIKDVATRQRVETTLKPFLTVRSPNPTSIKFVTDFARKTGDLAVLSKPDIQIIALTYEIECERNGGDWRLRKVPGQKGLNGAPPTKEVSPADGVTTEAEPATAETDGAEAGHVQQLTSELEAAVLEESKEEIPAPPASEPTKVDSAQNSAESQEDSESDSDSEGWITPSNLKRKQAEDAGASTAPTSSAKALQVAVLTSDFAMQNVILQINLNLLSPSMSRIHSLKTYILRCHACFHVSKDLSKQFCPRCGQPSLTRVACSTNSQGEFHLHLKKNMQWNNRGNRFSVPKPVHGTANGKNHVGGGKQGWGHDLILAEDQKEFERAKAVERRSKERSLMDEDYLPGILTGDRRGTGAAGGGRTRVGAGRNVNSRKR